MAPRTKSGFYQQLLGRIVRPNPMYFDNNNILPWPFKPNLSNEKFGTIEAAWVEDESIRIAVRGPDGTMSDKLYLNWVLLDPPTPN